MIKTRGKPPRLRQSHPDVDGHCCGWQGMAVPTSRSRCPCRRSITRPAFHGAASVRDLALRLSKGQAISASLSLARTAALLMGTTRQGIEPKALSATNADYSADIEANDWGSAHRELPPVSVAGAPIGWRRPASRSGSAPVRRGEPEVWKER